MTNEERSKNSFDQNTAKWLSSSQLYIKASTVLVQRFRAVGMPAATVENVEASTQTRVLTPSPRPEFFETALKCIREFLVTLTKQTGACRELLFEGIHKPVENRFNDLRFRETRYFRKDAQSLDRLLPRVKPPKLPRMAPILLL